MSNLKTTLAQGAAKTPTPAGDKVTVACNLPSGVRLRGMRMVSFAELLANGTTQETKIAEATGDDVIVHGNAVPFGEVPKYPIVAGYALTKGVDKELFDSWFKFNERHPAVLNKCIFAYPSLDQAEDAARDHETVRSGLEPFMQDADPRRPRARNANLLDVGTLVGEKR